MSENQTTANRSHGQVRYLAGHGFGGADCIGITLAGTEHVLTVNDALRLSNAVIYTCVDREDRNMREVAGDYD